MFGSLTGVRPTIPCKILIGSGEKLVGLWNHGVDEQNPGSQDLRSSELTIRATRKYL
jgi:hypothetical protein